MSDLLDSPTPQTNTSNESTLDFNTGGINRRIKKSILTDKDLEDYIKKGGSYSIIPTGVSTNNTETNYNNKNKNHAHQKGATQAKPTKETENKRVKDAPKEKTKEAIQKPLNQSDIKDIASKIAKLRQTTTTTETKAEAIPAVTKAEAIPAVTKAKATPIVTKAKSASTNTKSLSQNSTSRRKIAAEKKESISTLAQIGLERVKKNYAAKMAAIAQNLSHFQGECETHKETTFLITTNAESACALCRNANTPNLTTDNANENNIIYYDITKAAINSENFTKNFIAYQEAGKKHEHGFKAVCERHGDVIFVIYPNGTCACSLCEDEQFPESESSKLERTEKNNKLLEQALSNNQTIFTGVCHKHGAEQFTINSDNKAKCDKCDAAEKLYLDRLNPASTLNKGDAESDIERINRQRFNAEAKKEAIKRGEKRFTGKCSTHQLTTYHIENSGCARCLKCRKGNYSKVNFSPLHYSTNITNNTYVPPIKQTLESSEARQSRVAFNKKAKEEAVAANEKTFDGLCVHHGSTKYYIDSANLGRCYKCKNKYQTPTNTVWNGTVVETAHNKALRKAINALAKSEAIEKNQKIFAGLCFHHQECEYAIDDSGVARCTICRQQRNRDTPYLDLEYKNHKKTRKELTRIAIATNATWYLSRCTAHKSTLHYIDNELNGNCEICKPLELQPKIEERTKILNKAIQEKSIYSFINHCNIHKQTTFLSMNGEIGCAECALLRTAQEQLPMVDSKCKEHNVNLRQLNKDQHICPVCSTNSDLELEAIKQRFPALDTKCEEHDVNLRQIDENHHICPVCVLNSPDLMHRINIDKSFKTSVPDHLHIYKNANNDAYRNRKLVKSTKRTEMQEAILNKEMAFLAPCDKHGLSTYIFIKNHITGMMTFQPQCLSCLKNNPTTLKIPPMIFNNDRERKVLVIALSKQAKAQNKKYFFAPCQKHGVSYYRFINNEARCDLCAQKTNKETNTKNDQTIFDNKTKAFNAYLNNSMTFVGVCRLHGYQPFRMHNDLHIALPFRLMCRQCQLDA